MPAQSFRSLPRRATASGLFWTETLPPGTLWVHLEPREAAAIRAAGTRNDRSFIDQLRAELDVDPTQCMDVIINP